MRRPRPGDSGWVWVLSITWRGTAYHWTSRAVTLEGTKSRYVGLVSIDPVPERLSLRGTPALPEISVSINWPPTDPVASGPALAGTGAQLAIVPSVAGVADWSSRAVVVRGLIGGGVLWGRADEPVSFAVVRFEDDDRSSWPPATWRVTEYTWPVSASVVSPPGMPEVDTTPTYTDPELGTAYPVPWGTPGSGYRPSIGATTVPAVPAIVVDKTGDAVDLLLACGGRPEAVEVQLWYLTEDDVWGVTTKTLTKTVDAIGQPVATIDISGDTAAIRTAQKYFTSWPGGGVLMPGRTVTARTVGQLALWWLQRSGVPVDIPASLSAAVELDGYRLDGWLEEPTSASEWIADRLTGAVPCFLATSADGSKHLASVRWQASKEDSCAKLVEGDGTVRRIGRVETIGDGRARTIVVRWGWSASVNGYAFTTYRYVDGVADETPVEVSVELPDCYRSSTAELVAQWLAWRDGAPRDRIPLAVATDQWGWLSAGDIVAYTEAEIGMSGRVCIVSAIDRTDQPWAKLELLPIR